MKTIGLTAAISPDSPGAALWIRIFGGLTVPIKPFVPDSASVLPHSEGFRFFHFRLDVAALTSGQRNRLVLYLAEHYRAGGDEVAVLVDGFAFGLPRSCLSEASDAA